MVPITLSFNTTLFHMPTNCFPYYSRRYRNLNLIVLKYSWYDWGCLEHVSILVSYFSPKEPSPQPPPTQTINYCPLRALMKPAPHTTQLCPRTPLRYLIRRMDSCQSPLFPFQFPSAFYEFMTTELPHNYRTLTSAEIV